jgi:hypothetical protein
MARQTKKYVAASVVGLKLDVRWSTAEELYAAIEAAGYMWDSEKGQWFELATIPAQPASKKIMVRVWTDKDKVGAVAQAVITKMLPDYGLIQATSKCYPCRPPQHNDARIYLEFMPLEKPYEL